jgi:pheromone shutdown-related protein TraB
VNDGHELEGAPESDRQGVRRVMLSGRQFVLVGTAHVSSESVADVRRIVAEERPDAVCVELDAGRHRSLTGEAGWHELDIGKVLREGKGFLLLANLVLASFQRRLGSDLGVRPGEEMLAAMQAAQELSIPYVLADRDIQVTLRRAWASTGWWGRSKMLAAMLTSVVSNEKLDAAEIEHLKQSDVLAEMMQELADYLPAAKKALIDERDRWLASRIFTSSGAKVVAVVGAGHLEGIVGHLEALHAGRESADISDIADVPPRGWAGRLLPWIVPAAIVALFVAGFFKSGLRMSLEMALKWLIANGGLAALGSLLALAHPLTILVGFVGAPIATLNPFIGIGLFTGAVEAFLRKPRVSDFERLQQDIGSLKGFYTNRVTRILLVFFLSSIGGMVGNFIAIPWIGSLLGGK